MPGFTLRPQFSCANAVSPRAVRRVPPGTRPGIRTVSRGGGRLPSAHARCPGWYPLWLSHRRVETVTAWRSSSLLWSEKVVGLVSVPSPKRYVHWEP